MHEPLDALAPIGGQRARSVVGKSRPKVPVAPAPRPQAVKDADGGKVNSPMSVADPILGDLDFSAHAESDHEGMEDNADGDLLGDEDSKEQIIKGPWSNGEDEQLMVLVRQYGPKRWSMIASQMPGRIGKQVLPPCLPAPIQPSIPGPTPFPPKVHP